MEIIPVGRDGSKHDLSLTSSSNSGVRQTRYLWPHFVLKISLSYKGKRLVHNGNDSGTWFILCSSIEMKFRTVIKYKTKNSKICVRIKFGIKYMESSQNFFFPIGAPKQVKMIVKLIRLYISLNVKNVKNLGKKRKGTRKYAICELFYVGETNNLERFQLCSFFFFLKKRLCLWV